MNNYLTAIELCTTKAAVAVGEKTPQGIRIVSYCTSPIRKGVMHGEVVNTQKVIEALKPAIEKAEEETGDIIENVILCLSSQFIRSEMISLKMDRAYSEEFITKDEVDKIAASALKYEVLPDEQIFEAIPQSFNIDDQIGISRFDVEGMKGKTIEAFFKLIIGKASSARHKKEVADKCGLRINHTILSPLASSYAVLTEQEKENGVALLDIGGGTTDVVIVKDKTVCEVAVIPFGGNTVTEDIRHGACVTYNTAEYIKVNYGSCVEESMPENKKLIIPGTGGSSDTEVPLLFLAQIIEARMSEIFEAAHYIIEQSGYSKKIPAGVVITGGSCYMENIRELAKAILGYNIRLASPQGSITDDSNEAGFDAYSSSAVGAVIDGLENHGKLQIRIESAPLQEIRHNRETIFDEPEQRERKEIKEDKRKSRREKRENNEKKEPKRAFGGLFDNLFDINNNNA